MRYSFLSITILLIFFSACSKIPQLPALPPNATILAFGDSLTFGTGVANSESYPAILSQLTGRKVINAGVPGEVSAMGTERLAEILVQEKPSLLILCHGGNDLLAHQNQQKITDNLRTMIVMAKNKGISVVLVAVPSPDLMLKPPQLYEELSKELSIPIELHTLSKILRKGNLKSDYIHPNAAGYHIFATDLYNLLKKCSAIS